MILIDITKEDRTHIRCHAGGVQLQNQRLARREDEEQPCHQEQESTVLANYEGVDKENKEEQPAEFGKIEI
jgi:hypothetical protein